MFQELFFSDLARVHPPCMRVIVKETNLSNLKVGSLFIVTYIGGSIGREGDHSIVVPDINISKVGTSNSSSLLFSITIDV